MESQIRFPATTKINRGNVSVLLSANSAAAGNDLVEGLIECDWRAIANYKPKQRSTYK